MDAQRCVWRLYHAHFAVVARSEVWLTVIKSTGTWFPLGSGSRPSRKSVALDRVRACASKVGHAHIWGATRNCANVLNCTNTPVPGHYIIYIIYMPTARLSARGEGLGSEATHNTPRYLRLKVVQKHGRSVLLIVRL